MTARDCLFIYLCIFILLTFLLPSHGSVQFSSVRFGSRTVFALSLHSHSSFLSFLIFVLLTSAQTLCFVVFLVYICFDLIVSPRLRNARASKRVQAIHFLSFYIYICIAYVFISFSSSFSIPFAMCVIYRTVYYFTLTLFVSCY